MAPCPPFQLLWCPELCQNFPNPRQRKLVAMAEVHSWPPLAPPLRSGAHCLSPCPGGGGPASGAVPGGRLDDAPAMALPPLFRASLGAVVGAMALWLLLPTAALDHWAESDPLPQGSVSNGMVRGTVEIAGNKKSYKPIDLQMKLLKLAK